MRFPFETAGGPLQGAEVGVDALRSLLTAVVRLTSMGAVACLAFSCRAQPLSLGRLEKPTEFVLTDQGGATYHYTPASGTIRLIFFGYTSCPDFCPTTLSKIEKAVTSLNLPSAERPEILFISIDPERDTPTRLKTYVQAFHLPIRALTGKKAELDPIAKMFGTYYRIEKKNGETVVDHSTYVYLVDPEGTVRYHFKTGDTPDRMAEGILALHAEMN